MFVDEHVPIITKAVEEATVQFTKNLIVLSLKQKQQKVIFVGCLPMVKQIMSEIRF